MEIHIIDKKSLLKPFNASSVIDMAMGGGRCFLQMQGFFFSPLMSLKALSVMSSSQLLMGENVSVPDALGSANTALFAMCR